MEARSRTIKATVAYDGSNFCGWQVQENDRTVQGEIESALAKLHKQPIRIQGAGRTDSGVHAAGQVFSFKTDIGSMAASQFVPALNANLAPDIRVLAAAEVSPSFHARFSAVARTYRYRWYVDEARPPVCRGAARAGHRPDIRRLNRLAAPLLGVHDFSTFTIPSEPSQNRTREVQTLSFFPSGALLVMEVRATAFLWRMVRLIAGTLMELDRDGGDPPEVARRLAACDHAEAGTIARAEGLTLHSVSYPREER
ncbi:MAG: tRNA pseudouridine(38-40) synthase TruA [Spirochaetales bacterium]